jgi:arylsulfatase A-like enzyme
MKLKNALKVLTLGIFVGFIFGLAKSLGIISSNSYFYHKLYRLILFELTEGINKGMIYGLAAAVVFMLLIETFFFIWRKILSGFVEIRVIKRNKLTLLDKGALSLLILAYLIIDIIKFSRSPIHNFNSFVLQLSIVLILFLFIIRLEKILFFLSSCGILSFLKRLRLKAAAASILSILLLLNILTIRQRLFFRPSAPNILLIVADALRADYLGCYGYSKPTSPNIDKFAAESLVFEKALSNSSWTKPSIGSVFTSLYPHEHGAVTWSSNLSDKCLTLAELLRNNNYSTFAIQTNPSITKKHNFNQGFQDYQEMIMEKGGMVTSKFNAWVKKKSKAPFFAYLHYMDTHVPYNAPKEFSRIFGLDVKSIFMPGGFRTADVRLLNEIGLSAENKQDLVSLYDGAIKYFDLNFGWIIDNLKKCGILDKTIIILTADHGEEFWEHGGFAHGHSLHTEVLHVPLIIKYSTKLPSKRINSFVQLIDLFPTILKMSGIRYELSCRGHNLIRLAFRNEQADEEIYIETVLFGPIKRALLKDGWMLIKNLKQKREDTFDLLGGMTKYLTPEHIDGYELYKISKDFSEKNNLVDDFPQIVADMDRSILRHRVTNLFLALEKKMKLKEKLEDLRTLGYVD